MNSAGQLEGDASSISRVACPLRVAWLLAGIVLVGLSLRFYRLEGMLVFSDQAFCWRVASCGWSELIERVAGDTHPPGYFVLLKLWMSACGDSPLALRSLSVLMGTLCIPAIFALLLELVAQGQRPTAQQFAGALVAAALMALHYVPVEASRIARMYPCGLLMTIVSSWLLLRCLREVGQGRKWWVGYGLATAGLVYCHNYALFTVAAQIAYLAYDIICRDASKGSRPMSAFSGPLFAGLTAMAIYVPWVPRFLEQATRVQNRFWIPPLRVETLETTFLSWFAGIGYGDGMAFIPLPGATFRTVASLVWCYLLLVEVVALWAVFRQGRTGMFLVLLAVMPWALAIGLSEWSGRPILQPRYLTFAEVGLFGLVGVAVATLPRCWLAGALTGVMLCLAGYGTWSHVARFPQGPPVIDAAAKHLARHWQDGDTVIVSRPKRLLELRYHLHRAGVDDVDVRCPISLTPDGGHTNLVAGLTADDVLWTDPPGGTERVWIAAEDDGHGIHGWMPTRQLDWRETESETWEASDDWEEPSYTLRLFVRESSVEPNP
jgi:mannosyltransferase